MIEEGENLLRRSYNLEKEDLALSLSLATNAASKSVLVSTETLKRDNTVITFRITFISKKLDSVSKYHML